MKITASAVEPTDSSKQQFKTLEVSHQFELELYVPLELCLQTQLDELLLVEMQTTVLGSSQTQTFDDVQDLESKNSGDNSGLTFCGARQYSIVD